MKYLLSIIFILFSLSAKAQDNVVGIDNVVNELSKKKQWSSTSIQSLTEFLHNYGNDCISKKTEYLEKVCPSDVVFINENYTREHKIGKGEFFKEIESKYKNCQNITVDSVSVYKIPKGGELYGLQIQQEYHSGLKSEKSYFFIMLDINDPQQPRIRIFTSQSAPDPKFGLYGPGDF